MVGSRVVSPDGFQELETALLLREGLEARSPDPSERAIAQEEWAQFAPALRGLPEDKLMALQLRFVEKLSFKEIGVRLGC
jgi:DNA-directed RNA polymerase specialized sigma24 family protein